ncbi:MAG: site-specific integrase [Tannerella sp.]|nr:site-specific integrase [Tannerella sp.]
MQEKTIQKRCTFNLMCYVKKDKVSKEGKLPVCMRITVNKQSVFLSMKSSVAPELWNQAKEQSRGKDRFSQELNHYIESVKSRLYRIHRELEIDGKPITAQTIKDIFMGNNTEDKGKTLVEIHSEHNDRCRRLAGTEYSTSTIYKFNASLKFLQEFMKSELNIEDIPLNQINEDFIRKYELYLKTERGCCNNSAVEHLKIFKKIIRIALANDWIEKNPFVSIKFRHDEVHIEFLTMGELETIINKPIANKRLLQIRDVFVFCAFTGLAFVDVKSLRKEHTIRGNDGNLWIRKSREKTNNMCNIPLLQIPKSILEKYENIKEWQMKEQLLPVPTNQKMNCYLKEVADICGIDKRLTTHCARHTFATSITLANKVAMENVAKMLGHSSTRMTQHYARVLDQSIASDMMNVEKALENINGAY